MFDGLIGGISIRTETLFSDTCSTQPAGNVSSGGGCSSSAEGLSMDGGLPPCVPGRVLSTRYGDLGYQVRVLPVVK